MRVYASGSGLVKSAKPAIATRSRSAALVNEQESLGVEPLSLVVQERGAALARRRQSRMQASDVRLTSPAAALAQQMEVTVTVTVSPEESLLFAARVLQTAADQAEADTRRGRTSYVTEAAVKVLLWLCGSLLREDRDLTSTTRGGRPLRVLLQEAETELRRFPIEDYPAGTVDVVVGLCDLIRSTPGSPT
jgi:hypothetical protein